MRPRRSQWGVYLIAAVMSAVSLIPFLVLLWIALSTPATVSALGPGTLPEFHVRNFTDAWRLSSMGTAIMNSLLITASALAVLVTCASSAGFAIARFPGRFHRAVLYLFLFSMMIPGIINTVPLYTLMRSIGGINTRWAMALVCATNALPFSVLPGTVLRLVEVK